MQQQINDTEMFARISKSETCGFGFQTEWQAEASLEKSRVGCSKAWKNGEQTVSGGFKCGVKIVIGDWEKSGLYYVVTEQLARMSLVII